jgi:hypothetical protein
VRAERLALTRILLGAALLTDQLFQLWPNLEVYFGPHGVAPEGLHDWFQVTHWRWTLLFFNTDDMSVVTPVFWLWVAVTAAFTLGFCTRLMSVALWFLTLCFLNRNRLLLNGGDDLMAAAVFLVMFAPCGMALSVDSWWRRRRGLTPPGPVYTTAWMLRIIQIQLCMIYLTTGLAKLRGSGWLEGSWWDGTAIHYVLNIMTMSRWSYAQLPVPFWITGPMTYISVWWETLFPLLVMNRWTRKWALWFGVFFHLGIWGTIEVGWFSFYTLSLYGVWVPGEFWDRWSRTARQPVHETKS